MDDSKLDSVQLNNTLDDFSALKKSNQILLSVQTLITSLFAKKPEASNILFQNLLQSIGRSINVSRAYIFAVEQNHNEYIVRQTHEWVAEGIEPQIDNPITQNVNLAEIGLADWQANFLANKVTNKSVANLTGREKKIFSAQSIKVVVAAPIFVNGQWRGFIGFDDCINATPWSRSEIQALTLCANTLGAAFNYIDITHSKQLAEQQANDVEHKIHDALEAAEHGVWDWDLRTDKVYYSEILEKQLGYNGHEFSDALSEWSGRVHPDDIQQAYQKVKDHLAGKTAMYRAEFRMRKKDGSYAWMLAIARAIRDKQGQPIRLAGTHTDLSFQKKLEAELHKQQELLQALVKGFPDLVWLKDKAGVYLAANSRFEDFFGHPTASILGNTDYDFVDKALADFFRKNDQIAINRGKPSINEETITFANDGHQETLETIKTPIYYENGDLIGVLGVGRDITDRKIAQEQLKLAASVFENAHDGILICDADAKIIDVNPVFESISGFSKNDVIGKNPRILSSGRQNRNFYRELWQNITDHGFWQGELWNKKKNGDIYPILSNISSIRNEQGVVTHYLAIFTDITQLKSHQQKLESLVHFDDLTGLPNRTLLADRLDRAMLRSHTENTHLAVCFIDLDNFKPVNDQYGHAIGDQLLTKLGKRLKHRIRDEDTLARIGGDEFVLLLGGLTQPQQATELAQKVLKSIAEPLQLEKTLFKLSASMGMTLYPADQSDADGLIRHADQAMYEAKLQGRKRLHLFDVAANKAYIERNAILGDVEKAIQNNEFELFFQPKIDMKRQSIIGFEALIRWHHPDKGLTFPIEFLSAIEKHHLSFELDIWVLENALIKLQHWYELNHPYVLSINISPTSLLTEDFINELKSKLAKYPQIEAEKLEIEVLETSNFSEIEIAQNHLKRIRALGVRVALDDFGTGASSLSYLKNLPANVVKIDQSFIFDILDDRNDLAIVEGIIQLARVFDLEVIAEGVETKEHAEILYAMGCHVIQGYWIAKPIEPSKLESFIHDWDIPHDFKYK